jgi:hypothetical protein
MFISSLFMSPDMFKLKGSTKRYNLPSKHAQPVEFIDQELSPH